MTKALQHVHATVGIHGALHPAHVFLTELSTSPGKQSQPSLHDLGKYKVTLGGLGKPTPFELPPWPAPEAYYTKSSPSAVTATSGRSGCFHSLEADVFALGRLFYYTLTLGGCPFGQEVLEVLFNLAQGNFDLSALSYDAPAQDLISRMLDKDPKLRPTLEQVLAHPFFWSATMRAAFLERFGHKILGLPETDARVQLLESLYICGTNNSWIEKVEPALLTEGKR
jgi:serine/threonine-protein kinase/endoribonuclease IRE1